MDVFDFMMGMFMGMGFIDNVRMGMEVMAVIMAVRVGVRLTGMKMAVQMTFHPDEIGPDDH